MASEKKLYATGSNAGGILLTGLTNGSVDPTNTSNHTVRLNLSTESVLGLSGVSGANVRITGVATPTSATDAASKAYVDSVADGLDIKASVRTSVSTTTLDGVRGGYTASGGALTFVQNGTLTIDGILLAANDRVLVGPSATADIDNGIYYVSTVGDGSTQAVLTRSSDCNASSEFAGATVFVESGTNAGNRYHCLYASNFVVNTDTNEWTQYGAAGGGGTPDNNSVSTIKIQDGAVTTDKLAAGAVTAAKITAGTITGTEIANLTVASGNIADGAIGTTKIAAGAVTSTELANNAVTEDRINNSAVTTNKINDAAVTNDKLASTALYNNNAIAVGIGSGGARLAFSSGEFDGLYSSAKQLMDLSSGELMLAGGSSVDGAFTVTGLFTAGSWSACEAKWKDEVRDVVDPLGSLRSLKPKTWLYKADAPICAGQRSAGFLAQNLFEVFPDSVRHDERLDGRVVNDKFVLAAAVAAINQLSAAVTALETRCDALEKQLKAHVDQGEHCCVDVGCISPCHCDAH